MCKLLLAITVLLTFSCTTFAEFVCSSDVKYRWRKAQEEEITAHWAKLERQAITEAEAKSLLSNAVERERLKAENHCKREHEDSSGCIAAKLNSMQPTIASLSFSARKKLEETLIEDCQKKQGTCLKVEISDASCVENKPAEPAEADAKDKGKDKKKK